MRYRTRQLQLAIIMAGITLGITSIVLLHLYNTDLQQQQHRLLEAVLLDTHLIEAVAHYDQTLHTELQLSSDAGEATLSQVRTGLRKSQLLGQSERLYLIKKEAGEIIISASNYDIQTGYDRLDSLAPQAKLFNIALSTKSGSLIDYDQYGNRVVAAYAEIPSLGHTFISKVDITALQKPFIKAALIAFVIAMALVSFASYRFLNHSAMLTRKLEEKGERLRLLLESSGEAIYGIDLKGHCTFANPACVRMLGYNNDGELAGQHMHRLIHHSHENGEHYPEDDCHIYRSFIKDKQCQIDHEVFWKKDGTALPVEYSAYPIKQDGEIVGAVISFTDISERRLHEQALRESEQRYRTTFEDAFVGIAHVSLQGKFIEINHRLCEIVGYPKDELKKLTFMDITHPDDLEKDLGHIQQLLDGVTDNYSMEKRYFHKSGDTVWIELMVKLLRDLDGQPKSFISVINDITARKLSEKALQKAQEAHSQAEKITHFGNWDWDMETGSLHWTDEIYRIFGIPPQEFPATYEAFLERIHPEDSEKVSQAVSNSVADPQHPYNIEHRIIRPSGELRYIQEQGRVYRNQADEPIRMIGTVHDITERKLAEMELEQYKAKLEKLVDERTQALVDTQSELVKNERLATLGQLTATVSHELRNPLASIRSSLYVIEKLNHSEDEKLLKALDRVVRNVERCDHIIDELLDFTRSTTLSVTPTDFDVWLEELLAEQQIADDIELELLLGCKSSVVDIDQGKFQRAIINVVENACQAMYEQENKTHLLRIETSHNDDKLCLVITDNGPGITESNLPHIFEPLFSTKGFGTGLGLPTVKKIIEQHNGKIAINTKEGIGSSIIFTIPCQHTSRILV